jgi:hypothetical protein
MKQKYKEQLRSLKKKFQALPGKSREDLSVCLLKLNLGVQSDPELMRVKDFLEGFPLQLAPAKLDIFIDFLHSDTTQPPEIVVFEGTVTKVDLNNPEMTGKKLSRYREDEVETLKDKIRPFKR